MQMVDADAGVPPVDAAAVDTDAGVVGTTTFESAPMTKIEPVGPCGSAATGR